MYDVVHCTLFEDYYECVYIVCSSEAGGLVHVKSVVGTAFQVSCSLYVCNGSLQIRVFSIRCNQCKQ